MGITVAATHGRTNYIDTKVKWCQLKNWPVKGPCGRCLWEFTGWRYSQSYWYFRPSFVNCCLSNLFSGSALPPPSLCEQVYCTVYTYTVRCLRGRGGGGYLVWASGLQTDKHLPQSPFTSKYFDDDILFALPSMRLIFLHCRAFFDSYHLH